MLPAFVIFLLFIIYPIFRAVYYSLFNWNGLGPAIDFVGLDNFRQILTDQVFMKAITNCLLIVMLSLTVQLPLALALAIMVGRDLPGRSIFSGYFFYALCNFRSHHCHHLDEPVNPDPERGLINALLVLIPGVQAQNFLGNIRPGYGLRFYRPYLEIFRIAHAVIHGWIAKHPQGDRRSCA